MDSSVLPVPPLTSALISLNTLKKGSVAYVAGFASGGDAKLIAKLREIGFAEGDEVELLGKGWLGGAPLSIRLNRTVIALRKGEAALIQVEPSQAESGQ